MKSIDKWFRRMGIVVVALIAMATLILLWGCVIEPGLLTVTNIEVADSRLPKALDGTRAVFFADLHVGSCYSEADVENVAKKIQELNPDILLFGGDFTQEERPGHEPDGARVSAAFAAIQPQYGKYAVFGNHDVWPDEMRGIAQKMLKDGGFTILENQAAEAAEGLWVAGTQPWPLHLGGNAEAEGGVARPVQDGKFTLLLAHEPAQANHWAQYPFALQLSGHTHSGQVALPLIGPLAKTYATEGYYAGEYVVDGMPLYVTRGVGVIDRRVRFFAPPEIVVVTLKTK